MARRTGLQTLRDLAFKMCRIITAFDPIIRAVYPNATGLHLALDSAMVACDLLVKEADATLPLGD